MGQGEKLRAGVPPVEQTSEGQGRQEDEGVWERVGRNDKGKSQMTNNKGQRTNDK
jgi:hypothetical protein